jgi:signal transduction histidine kinase
LRHQFLGSLEKLVDRQASLLRDLLDISRLDGGLETDWDDNVNLQHVISDAVEQVRPQAEKKGLQLQNTADAVLDGKELSVPGNTIQLQRAIVNILTNAINYTNSGGVTVTCIPSAADTVALKISDTGIGIDANDLPHIFERFYRADKSRTRNTAAGGTGLGLAITQEIIARHHGRIEVESVVGKGSTFTIQLPAFHASRMPTRVAEL